MGSAKLSLDRHGRVIIPAALRAELEMKPGDRLVAWVEGGRLIIQTRNALIRDLHGKFRTEPGEESPLETLREMRRADFLREEQLMRGNTE